MVHSAEELSGNTDVFEAEIRVERMRCLVSVQTNDRFLDAALISATRVLWDLDLEEVVSDRVLELKLCLIICHAFNDMLQLSEWQAEFNKRLFTLFVHIALVCLLLDVVRIAKCDIV